MTTRRKGTRKGRLRRLSSNDRSRRRKRRQRKAENRAARLVADLEDDRTRPSELGPCCSCGAFQARGLVTLPGKAPIPGTGIRGPKGEPDLAVAAICRRCGLKPFVDLKYVVCGKPDGLGRMDYQVWFERYGSPEKNAGDSLESSTE